MASRWYIRNASTCDAISGVALYDLFRSARSGSLALARAPTRTSAYAFNPPVFAGICKRSVAALIDCAFVAVASGVIAFGLGCVFAFSSAVLDVVLDYAWLLGLVVSWLYFSLLESSAAQATFGQRVMGIVIVDSQGRRISIMRAMLRYFASAIAGFGSVLVLFTMKRQALYDLMAGCLVLDSRVSVRRLATGEGRT